MEDTDVYTTKNVAESFDSNCYRLMTSDTIRNKCYKLWIESCCKEELNWLEIGPGNDIALSKLLLDNYQYKNYYGIEVNKKAYTNAKKLLSKYKNTNICLGYLDEKYTNFPKQINVILHEIFGVIASSEGVAKTTNVLFKIYPDAISIPQLAITYIVPLEMLFDDIAKDETLTINPKIFRAAIPFKKCRLTETDGLLEFIELKSGFINLQQTEITNCKINKDGTLNVLGLYIRIESNEIYTTSNKDIPNYSSNWTNVGILLSNPINVKKNKMLTIISNVDLTVTPKYKITIKYEQYEFNYDLNYNDLYGKYEYLHTVHF